MAQRESVTPHPDPLPNGERECAEIHGGLKDSLQNFSTQGRNSISQLQALRGCCNTFQ